MQDIATKGGNCKKCNAHIQIGIGECVTQCKNCRGTILFLCHIIKKKSESKTKIICDTCNKSYAVIVCSKCKGYKGIQNFMSGFPYQCSCHHKATYVLCNSCQNLLSLPAQRNYQNTKIKCKSCKNQFRFKICSSCRTCLYNPGNDASDYFLCTNQSCPESNAGKKNFVNPYGYDTSQIIQQLDNRVVQFQRATIKASENPQSKGQKDVCKVCQDSQAIMINTSCFHLALCETCTQLIIKKQNSCCPICRAQGEYKKVFKP